MGTLTGYKVVELAGIGPCPMAGMMLADMGADVIRIERSLQRAANQSKDPSARGKKSVVINMKEQAGKDLFFRLVESADAVIEGYRPGVVERLGIGPEECLARNPRLVYGRMTGWGQYGPLSQAAGHDINFIALTGALFSTGRAGQKPVPPLNLAADMGGGGMLVLVGVLAAMLEAKSSGKGQVVDASMAEGAAQLMWMFHGFQAGGYWNGDERGVNFLDGGSHFYDVYETADNKYVSVGAVEPQFYAAFIDAIGVDKEEFAGQMESTRWPELTEKLEAVFKTKSQQEWCDLMEGIDACFTPVLSMTEAPSHPHNKARETYIEVDGFMQPGPAPRFSRTPSRVKFGSRDAGSDNEMVLANLGYKKDEIEELKQAGILG